VRIEESILSNLIYSEGYTRKVAPFIKREYFSVRQESAVFDTILSFFSKYDTLPTKEALKIDLSNRKDLSDDEHSHAIELVDSFEPRNTHVDWLITETEKFCKSKSIYLAIMESIHIMDGKDKNKTPDSIPKLLQDALAVSFDVSVGHSYFDDAGARYDYYTSDEEKIPFDLNIFNKIYKGGMPKKSLIVVAAQSGGGKSLIMSHITAASLLRGLNVLYITMEMSENKISERVDANLLKVDISKIVDLGKEEFMTRIDKIKSKSNGKLYVKEYPPSSASAAHFRSLVEELRVKQGFVPDLVVVDYLGICASSRLKMGGSVNSYAYLKSVAEELRGLAIELDVPVLTGAQLNRTGFNNSDIDETSLAESMGLFMTADIMFAAIRTDELDELGQIMIKQLKNRYGDPNYYKRFVVGINRPRMFLYDLEESAQSDIMDTPAPQRQTVAQQFTAPTSRNRDNLESLNF
jgi:replicative DNA helicase